MSKSDVNISRLIVSGLPSHIKSCISFSIRLIVSIGGFGKDVKGYMSFGSQYDFSTAILPISVSFLWRHCIKQFSNSIIFGSKSDDSEFSLFFLKTIHRQLASFEFQENFLCFINSMVFDVREPMRRPWHFFAFNLNPEMFVNLSSIFIKFSKDLFAPSNIKDASSAKKRCFILFSFYVFTFYIWALSDLV